MTLEINGAAVKGQKPKVILATALDDAKLTGKVQPDVEKRMLALLKDWISSREELNEVLAYLAPWKVRTQKRKYPTLAELATALKGEADSYENKVTEARLAVEARKSKVIRAGMRQVVNIIPTKIAEFKDQFLEQDFWDAMEGSKDSSIPPGRYRHWYNPKTVKNDMQKPGGKHFDRDICIIHDAMSALMVLRVEAKMKGMDKTKKAIPKLETQDKNGKFTGTVGIKGGTPTTAIIQQPYRYTDTSVKEDHDWVKEARAHNMPLEAGPSNTTARMLNFVCWLGCQKHCEEVAWGIFAFWNTSYMTHKTGKHTFHEVMDPSRAFKVPYTPFEYPDHPPGIDDDAVDLPEITDDL